MDQEPFKSTAEDTKAQLLPEPETSKKEKGINKNVLLVSGAILLAALIVSGAILSVGKNSFSSVSKNTATAPPVAQPSGNTVPTEPVVVSVDDDAFLGKKDAPVTIIEFSDFQCPFCRNFAKDTLPQLKKEYIDTGKARFVYRDFPLSFHPGAISAAQGAECAREQGKFWELHDTLFAEQGKQGTGTIQFTVDDIKKWAVQSGVNATKFNQCLDSGKYKEEVEKDIADGTAAGVSGTPSTFINGRIVVGAQPFAALKVIIDEELKKAGK